MKRPHDDRYEEKNESEEKTDLAVLKIIVILLLGGLAPLFDTTMVNVAIHTLTTNLHTTVADIQWVITGYLLAMSMTIPLSGWAVSRFGGKRMWLFSLVLFLIGSVLSAFSWDVTSLIGFRIMQGIGAGLIVPILMTMSVQTAGGDNFGRIMSIMSLPALFAPICGPVVGGIIVHTLGWHWIFLINIPICILAIASAWRELPNPRCNGDPPAFPGTRPSGVRCLPGKLVRGVIQRSSSSSLNRRPAPPRNVHHPRENHKERSST